MGGIVASANDLQAVCPPCMSTCTKRAYTFKPRGWRGALTTHTQCCVTWSCTWVPRVNECGNSRVMFWPTTALRKNPQPSVRVRKHRIKCVKLEARLPQASGSADCHRPVVQQIGLGHARWCLCLQKMISCDDVAKQYWLLRSDPKTRYLYGRCQLSKFNS